MRDQPTTANPALLLVEWVDSHSSRRWQPIEEMRENSQLLWCRSIGWLVAQSKDGITLAATLSGEKNGDIEVCGTCDIFIPACAIKRTTRIRTARKRRAGGGRK